MANFRLAQVLADAGHAVDVITYPFGEYIEHPGVIVHRCRRVPFVKRVCIGFSVPKALLDINLAFCALGLARSSKFDCIHGVEEGAFIAALMSRKTRAPFVYDMDSIISHGIAGSPIGKFPPMVWLARVLERAAIRGAILVMTICDGMADYVKRIDLSKEVVVVPDAPLPLPPGGANAERALAQMPSSFRRRKLVVYTGSFASYQGLDMLVKAMARVIDRRPEAALVIVGGAQEDIKRLKKAANSIGMIRNLLLMGKRPPEQVPDFLAAADVLVSPRRGGINPPGKIYTYMQSGRPIVATDIPAHTDVLGRDAAILVEPTPEGIAEGILQVFDRPGNALRRACRAGEIVSAVTPELQAQRILEAYGRIEAKIEGREPVEETCRS